MPIPAHNHDFTLQVLLHSKNSLLNQMYESMFYGQYLPEVLEFNTQEDIKKCIIHILSTIGHKSTNIDTKCILKTFN